MADNKFIKFVSTLGEAAQTALDNYLQKSQTNTGEEIYDRKALIHVHEENAQQEAWIERSNLVGPLVLRQMSRKSSPIVAVIQTRLSQISNFAQPQKDKYSAGWKIIPKKPIDLSRPNKTEIANPELSDEERNALKYKLFKKLAKEQDAQEERARQVEQFIACCGADPLEYETLDKRVDFERFLKVVVKDRLIYNYSAVELIPTMDGDRLSRFYPVSAGHIRLANQNSSKKYQNILKEELERRKQQAAQKEGRDLDFYIDEDNPIKYVLVYNGS